MLSWAAAMQPRERADYAENQKERGLQGRFLPSEYLKLVVNMMVVFERYWS